MMPVQVVQVLQLLVAAGLGAVAAHAIIGFSSRRLARRIVRQMQEREEEAEPDIPYSPPVRMRSSAQRRLWRIAMVAPAGLYEKATVKSRMLSMGISLTERGHDVTIFVPPWDCPNRSYLTKSLQPLQVVHVRPARWMPRLYDPFLFIRLLRRVLEFRPEVIYAFKPVGYSGAVSLAAYLFRRVPWIRRRLSFRRILVDADNWEGFGGWADRTEATRLEKLVRDRQEKLGLRCCDAVTAATKELKNRAESLRKPTDNVFYVPNAIRADLWPAHAPREGTIPDLEHKLRQLDNPSVLLLFTKFAEFRVEMLIAIFAEILTMVPNTALLVVGMSFDAQSRHQRLKLLPLADEAAVGRERIITVGWVPSYADLRKYWSVATVAVYPADDTFINRVKSPIKLLELMAAGKPIVANSVGEIRQMIKNGENGLLVPPDDIPRFAAAVVRLLEDPDLRTRLGGAAKDSARTRFGWRKVVASVERAIAAAGN